MDKLSALKMFVVTAQLGSFSRAAEQLGKTPSALTKAVNHLESELGARLFERSTRRILLTEIGRVYLETARLVLQRLDEASEEIEQLQHGLRGSLKITAPLAYGRAFLDQVCDGFLQQYPRSACKWTCAMHSSICWKVATTWRCARATMICRG
jgi:DNA-binding transcriptional LysR family regulator